MVVLNKQTSRGPVLVSSRTSIRVGTLEAEVIHAPTGHKTVVISRDGSAVLNLTAEEWYALTETVSWK